jgi:glucans biosynthesis protein
MAMLDYVAPAEAPDIIADLDYDDYRKIQFNPQNARWNTEGSLFRMHAFHPGWLFKTTVRIHEVVNGQQIPVGFSTDDFIYGDDLIPRLPEQNALPGVVGFRVNTPLNSADRFDELISFLGATYFRALARGNSYGLSARGLAINTGLGRQEEFPKFTDFWLERPAPGQQDVIIHAALAPRRQST